MSHFTNPLATAKQLFSRTQETALPIEHQECIIYHTSRLTEAAGILLKLPRDVTAQAVVLLQRYWLIDDMMKFEFSDVSAASIYLTAKISASPRSLRSITNVYSYLLSPKSALFSRNPGTELKPDPSSYYLSETAYITFRNRLLNVEGHVLNALQFNTHVALPHALSITYLQTLDIFNKTSYPAETGPKLAALVVRYLNTALLSPQLLYLTHQPNALAVAAIYLAARKSHVKLPEEEWWEVFDVDREELGFLVVGMGSLEGWVTEVAGRFSSSGSVLSRRAVRAESVRSGISIGDVGDEEDEMMRLLDEKVGA